MASNQVLAKSISMASLQRNNKTIYVSLLIILSFFLFLDYVPGMQAYSACTLVSLGKRVLHRSVRR